MGDTFFAHPETEGGFIYPDTLRSVPRSLCPLVSIGAQRFSCADTPKKVATVVPSYYRCLTDLSAGVGGWWA